MVCVPCHAVGKTGLYFFTGLDISASPSEFFLNLQCGELLACQHIQTTLLALGKG